MSENFVIAIEIGLTGLKALLAPSMDPQNEILSENYFICDQ